MKSRYLLNQGDLHQLGVQSLFLRRNGFDIEQVDVFSAVETEDEYNEAIALFYQNRVEGWWNYKDELIKYRICTEDEFKKALQESVDRKRRE
ncbi:L-rhamnose mutarotase [Sporomusaceae bacterium BoRhaA]|uniref:hypothetical protein n=1 Tax=Pelorhabdus rhamnosifermentans TaxID=2772457 RepID=UPI001C0608E4|nr:hypothetical protein [Pelorhabdus rhamnosifermentans]MBU2704102.1 L-rhamnose mutarotase [Pelorhabdus rhamnosifermentans]